MRQPCYKVIVPNSLIKIWYNSFFKEKNKLNILVNFYNWNYKLLVYYIYLYKFIDKNSLYKSKYLFKFNTNKNIKLSFYRHLILFNKKKFLAYNNYDLFNNVLFYNLISYLCLL